MCLIYSLSLPLHSVILLLTDQSYSSCFPQRPAPVVKVCPPESFVRLYASSATRQAKVRLMEKKKKKKCESVKSRQPTGLSLKESYDKAVGGEGS